MTLHPPLEAKASAELYAARARSNHRENEETINRGSSWMFSHRRLASFNAYSTAVTSHSSSDDDASNRHGHRHHRKHHHHRHRHDNKHDSSSPQDQQQLKQHKHRHPLDGTQHGMMIDAGSQGTRIHVYEFEARILRHKHDVNEVVAGRKLSIPTTDTRWTNRLHPGLDAFAYIDNSDDMMRQVSHYLQPLLEFAQDVLHEKRSHWHSYPIYLKATGGLRTLPRPYRVRLIASVRKIMQNKKFNPFFFENEHARVISGEEEAIYGWTAVNFVQGTLIHNSKGSGAVSRANKTYGVLEMGGASAQIGFYEPNGDVMASLFKLQLGAAKHWNVYTHSFLYFGVNGAYARLNAMLVAMATSTSTSTATTMSQSNDNQTLPQSVYNPCLPGGSDYLFTSRVQLLPHGNGALMPLSSPQDAMILEADLYSAVIRNPNKHGDFDVCCRYTQQLLRKEANAWCDFAHDRDCSLAGVYQPPLPIQPSDKADFGEFIATSNFYDVWEFLQLEPTSTMAQVKEAARHVCTMSLSQLQRHNRLLINPITDPNELSAMCFRATFVATFLMDGVGFPLDYAVTALDVVNKLGWALGSMLYEINTLPWEFKEKYLSRLLSFNFLGSGGSDGDGWSDTTASPIVWIMGLGLVLGFVLLVVQLLRKIGKVQKKRDEPWTSCPSESTRLLNGT